MMRPEESARPEWRSTGNPRFPLAAEVDGHWWVLRANPFPDHCLWTLFIDGVARYDIERVPAGWGRLAPWSAPGLDPAVAESALAPIRHLGVYGSEVGRPCDDPFCCG
ncbi:hypothetical protein [Nocardia sp. NBC_01329]|uniref:hypothetical protein n=1 Tax=Nocardia sp. NBC_01329 TaxID=2903594 RepID=UPI002E145FF5|nr:hypothetical protein OG405_03895 [Nocardia sp. NBC_01329]